MKKMYVRDYMNMEEQVDAWMCFISPDGDTEWAKIEYIAEDMQREEKAQRWLIKTVPDKTVYNAYSDSLIYIEEHAGDMLEIQLEEDREVDETISDYCLYCFNDWKQFYEKIPSRTAAERMTLWAERYIYFANQGK